MRGVALVFKLLYFVFLIPLRLIWLMLIKGLLLDTLLLIYRAYRSIKKFFRRVSSPENETQRTWLVSSFVALTSILIVITNVQASTSVREFGNQSLLAQLFDPVEELSVIEASDEEVFVPAASTSPQLLAAVETPSEADEAELASTSTAAGILPPIAGVSGALVKRSGIDPDDAQRRGTIVHTVQSGENASSIASHYGLKTSTLLWANNLNPHSTIRPGNDLKVPSTNGVLHKVKKNETLSSLAKKYEIEIEKIMDANRLVSAHQLTVDDELIIPGARLIEPVSTTRLARVRQIFNPNPTKVANSDFIWPIAGGGRRITQYYWLRHRAIDVGGNSSQSILASKAGRVSLAGWSPGYGYNVVVEHGGGVKTRYAHLSRIFVTVGNQVTQGEELGKMGTTGRSTGVHLHFEIIDNNRFLNPLSYL